jgi:hypothetical protein
MWTTRLTQAATSTKGAHNVILSRDDLTFVISLDDWWIMSATQHLADKALRENGLDFRISELYGAPFSKHPSWTTELIVRGHSGDVCLLRDGAVVAVFGLDEFAKLRATEFVVEDAVEVAHGLAQYGNNIEEVKELINDEFADEYGDCIESHDPASEPRKR